MRITDLLDKRSISLDGAPESKEEALNQMIALMMKSGKIEDETSYREQVYAREKEGTTGIGRGLAIPHGKCKAVVSPGLAAMVVREGVDFESLDGKPATLIFLIAAPDTEENIHLEVLSKLCSMLMDPGFADALRSAGSADEFMALIEQTEEDKNSPGEHPANTTEELYSGARILAVTSCPTGIAHTYMAAEELEKAAKAKGCEIKVETRGSGGVRNRLTDLEINKADCIIVASDTKVPMKRFAGKNVIECRVSDGIGKADLLIERAVHKDAPVYQALQDSDGENRDKNPGRQIYMQLMNGVPHMIPFVAGGGILTAIAFLIDGLCVDVNTLDVTLRAGFGTLTPAAAWFQNIGSIALALMLPVLAGYIGMAIGDRPALALGFVGGMMASQGKSGFLGALATGFLAGYTIVLLRRFCRRLPGTLEKIAPVLIYPLAGILSVGLIMWIIIEPIMGSVNTALGSGLANMSMSSKFAVGMILGGMIPPCAVALAALLFRNKFTKEERENVPATIILGLAFITEGAIPYAASDPIHVLPACIIGSAAAGALSMTFGCTLMVPHGGIFVFPVVGNVGMYLVSLITGTVISAVLLGIIKKNTGI
ncbi:MAG: fructose PTS transporter subunit IIA [Fusicatenibacter sp.]